MEIHVGSINRSGYWAQAMYMTQWNIQPVLKYEYFDPNNDVSDIGFSTITLGVNYFFNDWTRLQFNYLYNAEEFYEFSNDEIVMQLQVKF